MCVWVQLIYGSDDWRNSFVTRLRRHLWKCLEASQIVVFIDPQRYTRNNCVRKVKQANYKCAISLSKNFDRGLCWIRFFRILNMLCSLVSVIKTVNLSATLSAFYLGCKFFIVCHVLTLLKIPCQLKLLNLRRNLLVDKRINVIF